MSAPTSRHPGLQVDQVRRVERVRLVVGEGAVELEVQRDEVDRQPGEDGRDGVAAHPVAGVDDDLQRADAGQVDQVAQVLGVRRRAGPAAVTVPGAAVGVRRRPAAARSRISRRPVSWPIGAAPARQSLMPLYCAGLWLAVNIAPGRSRLPLAK